MAKRARTTTNRTDSGPTNRREQEYADYLRSPHWRRFRRAYFKAHARKCFVCADEQLVGLHHRNYDCLGGETADDVVPLCQRCHSEVHRRWPPRYREDAHIRLLKLYQRDGVAIFPTRRSAAEFSQERAEVRQLNVAAIRLGCPTCGAKPGRPCARVKWHPRGIHAERKAIAHASSVHAFSAADLAPAQRAKYGL